MSSTVRFDSDVPEAIKAVREGAFKGILSIAIKVVAQAKAFSPVDLGQLKGSIMWKSKIATGGNSRGEKLSEPVADNEIIVGTAVLHGIYQEFGTRNIGAQPYLRPAISIVTSGTKVEKAMQTAMNESVRRKLERISGAFV